MHIVWDTWITRTAESGLYLADEKDFEVAEIKYALSPHISLAPVAVCLPHGSCCRPQAGCQTRPGSRGVPKGLATACVLMLHLYMFTTDLAREHAVIIFPWSLRLKQACHPPRHINMQDDASGPEMGNVNAGQISVLVSSRHQPAMRLPAGVVVPLCRRQRSLHKAPCTWHTHITPRQHTQPCSPALTPLLHLQDLAAIR